MKPLALVAVLMMLGSPAQAKNDWRAQECRYQGIDRGSWTQREVRLTIECATRKWSVPGGRTKAISVAACESGLRATATNGIYRGVFQHSARYWSTRLRNLAPAWDNPLNRSIYNARSNVVVAIRMAHDSGWGAWSCGG